MRPESTEMAGNAKVPGRLPSEGLVLTCEHGGKRIPASYRGLFEGHQALLDSHRGFDPGALTLARALAGSFAAPLVVSTISRLLVDLNRSIGHPRLHFEVIRQAPPEVRQEILRRYYEPYRARAAARVAQAIAVHGRVVHISSHSFTPELDGKVRNADIGLLYDPARPGEVALCERWKASLEACAPDLTVRRNYPYAGKGDGLTAWFRRRLAPEVYVGIELEVNQKLVFGAGQPWIALRRIIVESLCGALASLPGVASPGPNPSITTATPTAAACLQSSRQPTGTPP
jgi:predicted N-formylglutamate amidohydrolase